MNNAPQLANQVSEELEAIKKAFQKLLAAQPIQKQNDKEASQ